MLDTGYKRDSGSRSYYINILDFTLKTFMIRSLQKKFVFSLRLSVSISLDISTLSIGLNLSFKAGQEWETREPLCEISGTWVTNKRSDMYDLLIYTLELKIDLSANLVLSLEFRFGIVLEADFNYVVQINIQIHV